METGSTGSPGAQSEIQNPKSEILLTVIAVGNLLMGDDGVAVRIIDQLTCGTAAPGCDSCGPAAPGCAPDATCGGRIEYLDGSVGGLRLLNWIEQARRLLFVDAAQFGAPPARCRLFDLNTLIKPPAGSKARGQVVSAPTFSLHQTDLLGVLRLARQFYRVPPGHLLAIQIESVEPRDSLSPPLSHALPRLVRTVEQLARKLATGHHSFAIGGDSRGMENARQRFMGEAS